MMKDCPLRHNHLSLTSSLIFTPPFPGHEDEASPAPDSAPAPEPNGDDDESKVTHGFLEARAHMCHVEEQPYPHSHIYLGALMCGAPQPHEFSAWFAAFLDALTPDDAIVLPALQRQFPKAWEVVNRFYKLDALVIRPQVSSKLAFEPITLSVPFNMDIAAKMYPAILGCVKVIVVAHNCRLTPHDRFIGLLEVFRVAIAADPDAKERIFGL